MIKKIISGGQTGADQGALRGAELAGVETGGTAPKDFRTEEGPNRKLLKHYNLVELQNSAYTGRTRENVINSDGTLIFGDPSSRGSALTMRLCKELNKPCMTVLWRTSAISTNTYERVAYWLWGIETLNVAGNRESKNSGIYIAIQLFILRLVRDYNQE